MAIHDAKRGRLRLVSIAAALVMIPIAGFLIYRAGAGEIHVYTLGNWRAPFGIVLVVDRLSALMVCLTTALALPVLLFAVNGADAQGRHFHALFQLQIAGLNGAFLTGDLFNLFVFFEVLLLASYGLLMHGHGPERSRAGIAYVVLNLAGSILFLIALALLYGTLGTLNLADMARVMPRVPAGDQALVRTAMALLVVVFALKAALLPLSFWLPHVYAAASAPVAALFSIMTKVGVYALLRISTVIFPAAPFTADLLQPWLAPLAIATIAIGTLGTLAAQRLAHLVANLVVISTGTLLLTIAVPFAEATTAALYYLIHTTLVSAGFFLLTGLIAAGRGEAGDTFVQGPPLRNAGALGVVYFILAVAICGVPPLSGFIGKIMLLRSLQLTDIAPVAWTAFLASSFIPALVMARAASVFFWESGRTKVEVPVLRVGWPSVAIFVLLAASPVLSASADAVVGYARATAEELHAPHAYIEAVLGDRAAVQRERRP
jgi:multicomponent K+:H+ antiporter subunit D